MVINIKSIIRSIRVIRGQIKKINMKCVVIAAGYATRLGELTKNFPKPLLKIGENTILGRMLDDIDRIPEIDEHIIITNHKFAPIFEEWVKANTNNKGNTDDKTNTDLTDITDEKANTDDKTNTDLTDEKANTDITDNADNNKSVQSESSVVRYKKPITKLVLELYAICCMPWISSTSMMIC